MKRRDFTKGVATAPLIAAAANLSNAAPKASKPPNVVYYFSDTHRWGALPFTQTPWVEAPTMIAMKKAGANLNRCYSNLPICTPYRAILMTGRWPWQQGAIANHMSLAERVDLPDDKKGKGAIASLFRTAGYETGYFGKWHLGGSDARGFGFDKSIIWNGTNNHTKNTFVVDGGKPQQWTGVSNTAATTDQAIEWLERRDGKKPFFLMVSVNPPHANMKDAPPDMNALYPDEKTAPFHPHDVIRDFEQHRGYHAHISEVDRQVGRLRERLAALGHADNTIHIYTSDHGGMSGLRGIGYGQKRHPYDESARVPFIAEWPGHIPANLDSDALFSAIDILPTLCGLAGVEQQLAKSDSPDAAFSIDYIRKSPGLDISKTILGQPNGPRNDALFLMHTSNMNNGSRPAPQLHRAIVTDDYMYAVAPEGERCLFDNKEEYQVNNLVADPKMKAVKQKLRARLARFIAEAETPFTDRWFERASKKSIDSWYHPAVGHGGVKGTPNRGDFDFSKTDRLLPPDTPEGMDLPPKEGKAKKGKGKTK